MNSDATPFWLKRTALIGGLLLALPGLPLALNLLCLLPVIALSDSGSATTMYGINSLMLVLLTLGAGGTAFWHALRAQQGKPSRALRLPPTVVLMGIFGLVMLFGWLVLSSEILPPLFFPPLLVIAAALPPLWAVAWFIPGQTEKAAEAEPDEAENPQSREALESETGLTWRRGLLALVGGATLGVLVAIILEIIMPVVVFALVYDLAEAVMDQLQNFFQLLSYTELAQALTSRGFWYVFIQIAVIAPLAEEIAKPLIVLPLVKRLGPQETFWLGALAGAGFAALENIIYATGAFSLWAGILLVRALGGALHPLGAGLVALGWREVLKGEPNAWRNWFLRFGIAVTVHAIWNGGSLLVVTLAGARFFGDLPSEIDVLGLSAGGLTLAFLIILGLSALWIGRAFGHGETPSFIRSAASAETGFTPSDRALAIWAFACLATLVPAGIAGLKLWLR